MITASKAKRWLGFSCTKYYPDSKRSHGLLQEVTLPIRHKERKYGCTLKHVNCFLLCINLVFLYAPRYSKEHNQLLSTLLHRKTWWMYNTFPDLVSVQKGFCRFQGLEILSWGAGMRWITICNARNMYGKCVCICIILHIYNSIYTHSNSVAWISAVNSFNVTLYLLYKYTSIVISLIFYTCQWFIVKLHGRISYL